LFADRVDPVIAVDIRPALDEPPAACQRGLDGGRRFAFNRQQHRAVTVALPGVGLLGDASAQFFSIADLTRFDVHAVASLPQSHIIVHRQPGRNT
jgi:hypothetical protein